MLIQANGLGNYKILLAFIGFVLFLFAVKIITKH
jgi:hypothetical protein